ncbi:MAG: polyamine ABC transporter substrate-binding protein [Alphaproteobacteria bacterium]
MRIHLIAAAALLAAGLTACADTAEDDQKPASITVVSFGGAYQAAQREAYMDPFEAETGIKIDEESYDGKYDVLLEKATAPVGGWDVVSVESEPVIHGDAEGLIQPIPARVSEGLPLDPAAVRPDAIGHMQFATVLAFVPPEVGPIPESWADMWDMETFPGRRALRNNPRGTLEMALLADGVDPEALYPLDVDRALAKLDQIRNQLVFWEDGEQPAKLIADGLVAMTSIFNGRAWAATNEAGLSLGWTMNQGLLEMEYWVVPANAPNPEAAFDFIRFSLTTPRQTAFGNAIPYRPTNLDARKYVSQATGEAEPSADLSISLNAEWWAENEAAVQARWDAWVMATP